MRDIARATSAAPTYFTPVKLATIDRLNYYALVDGGVVAANPAMCAYAEAVRMCAEAGTPPEQILMVSLGTGEQRRTFGFEKACEWGQLEWAQPIIDIVLQGSNATVDYQLQYLLEPAAITPPTSASSSSSAATPATWTTPVTPIRSASSTWCRTT